MKEKEKEGDGDNKGESLSNIYRFFFFLFFYSKNKILGYFLSPNVANLLFVLLIYKVSWNQYLA